MFPYKSLFEIVANILANLSSAWFAVILVAPKYLNIPSTEFKNILIINLSSGILGLVGAVLVLERSRKL